MAQYLNLPNGYSIEIPDGMSTQEALAKAQQQYPELFGAKPQQQRTGIGGALSKGLESLVSSGRTGFEALTGSPEEAARRGLERGQAMAQKYPEQVSLEKVKKAYEEKGLLPAAGEALSQVPAALAEQAPNIATTAGAAKLGQTLGRPFGAVGQLVGAGLGAGLASGAQMFGSNIERQAAEQQAAGKPVSIDRSAAAMAAAPQAALDIASMAVPLGGRLVSKLTGIPEKAFLSKSAAQVQKLADEKLYATLAKGLGVGAMAEIPTEVAQQMLERAQAGLSLTSPDALKEYGETAYQVSLLAPLGGAGRLSERAGARSELAQEQERKVIEARQKAAADEEAKITALNARRGTDDYAMEIEQKVKDLLNKRAEYDALSKKQIEEGDVLGEQEKRDARAARKELMTSQEAKDLLAEYNQLKQSGAFTRLAENRAKEAERKRVEGMSQEDFMLEQMGLTGQKPAPRVRGKWQTEPAEFAPEPTKTVSERYKDEQERFEFDKLAQRRGYAQDRMDLAREQVVLPSAQDYADYLAQDTAQAMELLRNKGTLPGLNSKQSNEVYKALAANPKVAAAQEQSAQRTTQATADLKAQIPGKEEKPGFESEYLSQLEVAELDKQAGRLQRELEDMRRLAGPTPEPGKTTVTQGELFGEDLRVNQLAGAQRESDLPQRIADAERQLETLFAQRNAAASGRSSQYRSAINVLSEQIRDMREMLARQNRPETFGTEPGGRVLQEEGGFGQLPEQQRKQRDAAEQRRDSLASVQRLAAENRQTGKAQDALEQAQERVAQSLIDEITAARGAALRPETISDIEKQVQQELGQLTSSFGSSPDVLRYVQDRLDSISQRWRAGVEAGGVAGNREVIPTATTPEALLGQMDRLFGDLAKTERTPEAQTRYAPKDIDLANRIARSYRAFVQNPDRVNMAGEWMHRVLTTGRSNPELTRDLEDALTTLERGAQVESYTPTRETAFGTATKPTVTQRQLELPARLLPQGAREAVATAFDTVQEFQRFLAGDAVKAMRLALGQARPTASRIHETVQAFEKRVRAGMDVARKQLDDLQQRKKALEGKKIEESATVKQLISDAEAKLDAIYKRLDNELRDLQADYIAASLRFEAAATAFDNVQQQVTANIERFENRDPEFVAATQKVKLLKAEALRTTNAINTTLAKGEEGGNIQTLLDIREKLIEAIKEQQKVTNRSNYTLVQFVQRDLELQLQMQELERQLDRDGKALLNAGLALEEAHETAKTSPEVAKEIAQAQANIQEALGLKGKELAEVTGNIDAEIKALENSISVVRAELEAGERKLAPKQTKTDFEAALDRVIQQDIDEAFPSLQTKDAMLVAWGDRNTEIEDQIARLKAIPGERISFDQRREMLELAETGRNTMDEIENDIVELEGGISMTQAKLAADRKEVLELGEKLSKVDPFSLDAELLRNRRDHLMDIIKEREANVQQFQKRIESLQREKGKLERAYDKAVQFTSSDPEIVAAATRALQTTVNRKVRQIQENDEALKTGKDKNGKKLSEAAKEKRVVRRNKYMRELAVARARLSNRLGIERIDVTSEAPVGGRAPRASAEQQIQMQEAAEKEQLLKSYKTQMAGLKAQLKKATEEGRAASTLQRIQRQITKLQAQIDELAPKQMGAVSQATRIQSSAPGKFRTGTKESKATSGNVRMPVTEKRTVKAPSSEQAIREANEFAQRVMQAKTEKQREKLLLQKTLDERQQIATALEDNVNRLRSTITALEQERDNLRGSKGVAANERLQKINEDLEGSARENTVGYRKLLSDAEGRLAEYGAEVTKANEVEADKAYELLGTEMTPNAPEINDLSFDDDMHWLPQMLSDSIGPALQEPIDVEQNAAAVMNSVADTTQDPINKAVAQRLKMLLGNTRIEIVDDLRADNGEPACGTARSDGAVIELDRRYGMNETTVLHEGVHSATERVLSMPEDQLTSEQLAAKRELQALYEEIKADENFGHPELLANLSEFAAESLTNPVMRSYMQTKPWTLKYMWDAFKSAILRMLGVKMPTNMSEAAIAAVDRLMTKVPRPTAENTQLPTTTLPKIRYANTALAGAGAVADKAIAKQRTIMDAVREEGTGLMLTTKMVDRFAPLERLSKYMDSLKGMQMMYYSRMYDQRMNFVAQSVGNGALRRVEKTRADGRKEYVIESAPGASLRNVMSILRNANNLVGSADGNSRMFSMYLVAKRAERVGLAKLNYKGDITEQDLRNVRSAVATTPGLQAIYDKAQREYNQYNRDMLQFAVDSGAMSASEREKLISSGDYVPYYRERNGAVEMMLGNEAIARIGSIKDQPYLQELVGGSEPILDFMTSAVQNTNMLADMALRNLATKSAVHELRELGMATIGKGSGAATPNTVRFKEHGVEKYALVHTEDVVINGKRYATGIPGDLVVKGMEGIPVQNTIVTKLLGGPARALRKAVVLNPLYAARQLFRDSLAAPVLSGANFTPILGALKEVGSAAGKTLERRGVTGGQVFTGTQEDLATALRQIAAGENTWTQALAKLESMSMEADALTRRAQYNSYIAQGLSEMEATYMALESMNFSKRGVSPAMHTLSTIIPFFNAQIQSLNVLYKAFTGNMPFNEKLKIREKLYQRGMMIASMSAAYAALMQDDDTYENATPDQKYGNWFIHVPGVSEAVRVPIPFEVGYIFKAIPEAIVNTMMREDGGKEAAEAFKQIALQLVPGGTSYGVPQAVKPLLEVGLGKSFYTGRDLETAHEQSLEPGYRSRERTTALSRMVGETFNISPIKLDALIQGYFSTTGLALVDALSFALPDATVAEPATKKLSEMRLIGGLFQPSDATGIINATYDRMKQAEEVKATYTDLLSRGRTEDAQRYLNEHLQEYSESGLATQFKTYMQNIAKYERAVRAATNMTPDEKREMLDRLRQQKIEFAKSVREGSGRTAPQ